MKKFFMFLLPAIFLSFAHGLELYKDKAVVSYYADKFHGRKTANGETFDMNAMTCAHKSLPFNTVLRITNYANGKSVDVRVNDRGPFVEGREADLSKAAAIKLDMIKTGTAKVKIHIVTMGEKTKQSSVSANKAREIPLSKSSDAYADVNDPKTASYKNGTLYDIQLGVFSDEKNARAYAKKVAQSKIKNVAIRKGSGKVTVLVVKVDGKNVRFMVEKLEANGFGNVLVKERKK